MMFSRTGSGTLLPRIVRRGGIGPVSRLLRLVRIVLVSLALVLLKPASGQSPQSDDQGGTVHGTVVNAATNAPVPRALVHSSDDRFAMLTDSDGHFEFTLPKTKTEPSPSFRGEVNGRIFFASSGTQLWLTASKPGFLEHGLGRGERPVPASVGNEVTIPLIPEAVIKGRVNLSASDGAAGVSVQIYSRRVQDGIPRWLPQGMCPTNSSGEFRFAELAPGAYKVVTNEFMDNDPVGTFAGGPTYGYPPAYYPGVADFAAAATIDLAAGQTFEAELTINSQPYYDVKIPVANSSDDIPGGLNVRVWLQGQRGPGYSLGHNAAKGRIEGSLPNGNYIVEAMKFGQESASGTVNLKVAGAPAVGPTMTLTRTGSLTLEVKEEFNDTTPIDGGTWSDGRHTYKLRGPRTYLYPRLEPADDLREWGGGGIRPPNRPNDDVLVMENLMPGRYWLQLDTGRGYVAAATMGGVDLLHEPLVVGSGSSASIEIRMRDDGAELTGTVAGMSASPPISGDAGLREVWVYCVPLPDSPGRFQNLTSTDGTFTFAMMPAGSYRVLAFATPQEQLPYRDPEAMRVYESKGEIIHLSAGQKASVQVQVSSTN